MKNPNLVLRFIENAYTDDEDESEVVACFELLKSEESSSVWSMSAPCEVRFPTGDLVKVVAEVTPYGNYLHVRHANKRLCSIKAGGAFEIMFLLPCGQGAYAELVLP